jgi:hypothetical protein
MAVGSLIISGCASSPSPVVAGPQRSSAVTRVGSPVTLRSGRIVEFDLTSTWRIKTMRIPPHMKGAEVAFQAAPPSGRNVTLHLYIFPEPSVELADPVGLRARHETTCAPFAKSSVEQKTMVDVLTVRGGRGYRSSFTDKSLVHVAKPKPGSFRLITFATIYLRGGVFVAAELASDDMSSREVQEAIEVLSSLRVKS